MSLSHASSHCGTHFPQMLCQRRVTIELCCPFLTHVRRGLRHASRYKQARLPSSPLPRKPQLLILKDLWQLHPNNRTVMTKLNYTNVSAQLDPTRTVDRRMSVLIHAAEKRRRQAGTDSCTGPRKTWPHERLPFDLDLPYIQRKKCSIKTREQRDRQPIELHLEGKALTDDGIEAVASALTDILNSHDTDSGHPAQLSSLNLARNGLTAKSLAYLAPAVRFADRWELLDLSENMIKVETREELECWETFLNGLASAGIKKLSLSSNFFASRAVEVFTRTFLSQYRAIDWSTLDCEAENLMQDGEDSLNSHSNGHGAHSRVCGLPSIEIIDFSNVSMTDAGALLISQVVGHHQYFQQSKRSYLNALDAKHVEETSGIVYHSNTALSAPVLRLLRLAETHDPAGLRGDVYDGVENRPTRKLSGITDETSPGRLELDSLRWKQQRLILENHGLHFIELWSVSIRLMAAARAVYCSPREVSVKSEHLTNGGRSGSHDMVASAQLRRDSRDEVKTPTTYAARLQRQHEITPANSLANTPFTITFRTPKTVRSESSSSAISTLPTPPSSSEVSRKTSMACAKEDIAPIIDPPTTDLATALKKPYRDSDQPHGLPAALWQRILVQSVDKQQILSERQRRNVFEWARDRKKLTAEVKEVGKSDSIQIWKILEGMGCLTYDDQD
ncbi:hypothetical protein MRB53_037407 [Persea americana]|nr:hypothetical protein MRB53_037407 [Persea americana]